MAKKNPKILAFVAWLTGVIVSLAVGFGMIDGVLYVKWVPEIITVIAGWIVVATTIIGSTIIVNTKLAESKLIPNPKT